MKCVRDLFVIEAILDIEYPVDCPLNREISTCALY